MFQYLKLASPSKQVMAQKAELAGQSKTIQGLPSAGRSFPVVRDRKRAGSDWRVQYTGSFPASSQTKITPGGGVGKVLRILEPLGRSPAGLPLKNIAPLISLTKKTAHRFLNAL